MILGTAPPSFDIPVGFLFGPFGCYFGPSGCFLDSWRRGFLLALFGFSGLPFFVFFWVVFGTLQVGYRFCKKFVDTALWAPVARKILSSRT